MKKSAIRALSVLLVLTMVFSMLAVSVSGASLDLTEIAANEDANLGLSYDVQDVIAISEDQHHSIKIEVSGKSVDDLNKAINDGSIKLSLDRDETRPYVDSTLYPNAIAGGDMADAAVWATQNRTALFTNIELSAAAEGGKTVLNVEFDSNCYFYSRSNPDYSAPHSNGGAYLDICGWFKLTASAGTDALGTADLKVTPYDSFHTMPEVYNEIDEIVALANENGLYAVKKSMGLSTAGRDMPYMIVADSEESVNAWMKLTEKAQTEPTEVLASIEKGELDDIRVPILYSNIHANEVAAADGIMQFAWALAEAGIDGKFTYNSLTGFTAEGEAQLEKEMNDPSRCYANYDGTGTGVAVPDLVKDTATYLGYLQDGNGKSGVVDLDKFYTQEENEVSVKELLGGVFYILVPEENVDGRTYITRTSSNGYDLNRDNSFQTTAETANMQHLIGTYNPVSFTEFHGRVTDFQCEPCDPPHEPNFEYDLLAEHLLTGGEAFGIAAVANNDGYNSYVIPQRDYLSYIDEEKTQTQWFEPWDDMSTSYTPQFAMLHGTVAYTVELPAYSEDTATAVCYGMIGQSDFIHGEKLGYLKAQTTIYERSITNANSNAFELVGQWFCDQYDVEGAEMDIFRPEYDGEGENGNFYPECYLIPLDGAMQNNVQAAVDMMVWLARNDVKVNVADAPFEYEGTLYPAGTLIISMYQAKRSVANSALYDGTLINGWPALYSEGITSFNATRGFDMVTVTEPAAYEKIADVLGEEMGYEEALTYTGRFKAYFVGEKNADVIICNDSEDSTAAVNALLQAGKAVAMITGDAFKGDFVCAYEDYLTIAGDYVITAIGVYAEDLIEAKLIEKAPTVYIPGVPNPSTSGCIASSQVSNASWNYDRYAMELMNFDVTEEVAEADVFAGASSLSGEALDAVLAGAPYIGYGSSAARGNITKSIPGITRTGLSGSMDCLAYVSYPNETLVNSSYIAEDDDVMYGYGFGYFSSIPEGAVALVQADGSRMPTEGFIPTTSDATKEGFEKFLDGGVLGFSYNNDELNIALFANTLTQKVHQRDEYAYISNFIFSSMLSDEDYAAAQAPEVEISEYIDVKEADWFYEDVAIASALGLMNGTGSDKFSPRVGTSRAMIAAIVYRLEGEPTVVADIPFEDVKDGMWYTEAIRWAASYGIIEGYGNGKFGTDDLITREQVATILARYAEYLGLDVSERADLSKFTDADKVSSWAKDAVSWAVAEELIEGTPDSALMPLGTASRAEAAAILARFCFDA